jgi:hypothetical protein
LNRSGERSRYQVYILRLWREPADPPGKPTPWRFVLEEPKTGQRRGFKDFDALMGFLAMELQRQDALENESFNPDRAEDRPA